MDALEKRRSIRKYKPNVPTDDEIRLVVHAATLAPSACNLQVAEFVYVSDPQVMAQIAKAATGKVTWAPACIVGIYDSRFVRERCAHLQSLSAAVENMLLKATEMGLGTCWMAGFTGDDKIRRILSIPPHFEIACIVLIGYPDEDPPRPYKSPVEQILHFNKYERRRPHLNLSIDPRHWSPEEVAEYRRRIFSVYNRRAELGILSDSQLDRLWPAIETILTPVMPRDAHVCEVHAWDLRPVRRIAQTWPAGIAQVTVADPIQENLRIAKEMYPDCETVSIGPDYTFDIKDESVDLALLINRLEFDPAPALLFDKLVPKIKKGGKVLVAALGRGSSFHRLVALRFALVRIRDVYERSPFYKLGPFSFVREKEITDLLTRHGLRLREVRSCDVGLWQGEVQTQRRGRLFGILKFLVELAPAKSKECILILAEKS
ncbi:MAG: nitroreductase family protein [Planctomycetota bacterium]